MSIDLKELIDELFLDDLGIDHRLREFAQRIADDCARISAEFVWHDEGSGRADDQNEGIARKIREAYAMGRAQAHNTQPETAMDRRIGKFSMSRRFVDHNPEAARAVMGRCIVVRCEMMYASGLLEYVALSPDFEEVPDGVDLPEYDVISDESGRFEFKKRSEKPACCGGGPQWGHKFSCPKCPG